MPSFAAAGFSSLILVVLAILFFFLPQGVAVSEFAKRCPEEGGIYVWSKKCFGEFHGFLSGWCYSISNVFFIPTLLFYLVGVLVYVGGSGNVALVENRYFTSTLALVFLWLFTVLGVRGLGVGKWVNNAGGVGAAATALAMIGVGIAALRGGVQHLPTLAQAFSHVRSWDAVSTFGVICLSFVGLELGSTMGAEIKNPTRDVPRASLLGGIACSVLYLSATLALLLALPSAEISVIQGLLQAVERMSGPAGVSFVVMPLAVLLAVSLAGATSAWLAGAARVPFVAGLDLYLPPALGKLHPRHRTPHVALYVISVATSLLILLSFVGVDVYQAYLTLLRLTVVVNILPFLYLFAGLVKTVNAEQNVPRRDWLRLAGRMGFLATAVAMVAAFIPDERIPSVWIFEVKMFCGTAAFLGTAVFLFRWRMGMRQVRGL
ncbi:MAG: APC family permease [Acidobacteria bacterium]|nr:APC family permease [Acidobacteriota bacterium]